MTKQIRFKLIEDATIILISNGIYRQSKMYSKTKDGEELVFAGFGLGFIGLHNNHTTTHRSVKVVWDETDLPHNYTKYGRMVL